MGTRWREAESIGVAMEARLALPKYNTRRFVGATCISSVYIPLHAPPVVDRLWLEVGDWPVLWRLVVSRKMRDRAQALTGSGG